MQGGQKLAGLLIFITDIHALGLKTAQGLIFTDPWYWDQNDANRAFAKEYFAAQGRMPSYTVVGERTAAEPVERRAETKGNADQQRTRRTQRRISVSKMLARIRQHIVAVDTQGGNRMRESCTYGSVRGARGNSRPYRELGHVW